MKELQNITTNCQILHCHCQCDDIKLANDFKTFLKSAADKSGIPLKGCRTNRSRSLLMIQEEFAVIANRGNIITRNNLRNTGELIAKAIKQGWL